MMFHNPKMQSGTTNSLLGLNNQAMNNHNKSFNILENHNNLKTFDDNSSINNGLGMENNITNTDGSKNLVHKRISKELS